MSISNAIKNSVIITDEIAWKLTPRPLKKLQIGKTLIYILCIGLYFPLLAIYFKRGDVTRSIILFFFLSLVVISSLSLVSYGKNAAIKVIENLEPFLNAKYVDKLATKVTNSLSVNKQVLFGLLFSVIVVTLSQWAYTLSTTGLLVHVSVSISVAIAAFLVGAGLYLVLCIPQIYVGLLSSKFEIPTLLPYQTIELKRIANISAALSLTGAIISTLLSSLILGLAIDSQAFLYTFWIIIMAGVLGLSWITISIPFIASQGLLSYIVRQAKEDNLQQLRVSIEKVKRQLNNLNSDKKLVQIEKIQNLYDKIYSSPNTVLDWSMLGKLLSSLFLSLLPSIIGILLSR